MNSEKRHYKIRPVVINGIMINEVIIDSHYKVNHANYMNDELALELIKQLDGRFEIPTTARGSFKYFATLVDYEDKQYRVVWLLEHGMIYIGLINAYRDRRKR